MKVVVSWIAVQMSTVKAATVSDEGLEDEAVYVLLTRSAVTTEVNEQVRTVGGGPEKATSQSARRQLSPAVQHVDHAI
jgi:hypothetical protein